MTNSNFWFHGWKYPIPSCRSAESLGKTEMRKAKMASSASNGARTAGTRNAEGKEAQQSSPWWNIIPWVLELLGERQELYFPFWGVQKYHPLVRSTITKKLLTIPVLSSGPSLLYLTGAGISSSRNSIWSKFNLKFFRPNAISDIHADLLLLTLRKGYLATILYVLITWGWLIPQ